MVQTPCDNEAMELAKGTTIGKKKRTIKTSRTLREIQEDDEDRNQNVDNEQEEEDEEKMEQFFALIRGMREARDRLAMTISSSPQSQLMEIDKHKRTQKKLKVDQEDKGKEIGQKLAVSVWTPCFKPEDFAEDHARVNTEPLRAMANSWNENPSQGIVGMKRKKKDQGSLDLTLSL